MILRDVGLVSPPFGNSMRNISNKRARSPEPFDAEHPSKRVLLDHRISYPVARLQRRLGYDSADSSRHSSEDWVQQARGLRIDSPIYVGSIVSEVQGNMGRNEDDDMMVEVIEQEQERLSCPVESFRPQVPPLQLSGLTSYMSQFPSTNPSIEGVVPPFDTLTVGLDMGYGSYSATSIPPQSMFNPSHQMIPANNVTIPTPIELGPQQYSNHTTNEPTQGLERQMGFSSFQGTSTSKRPRFTMGPRADCEKCRLGVKGHSVHWS